jgi:hypothetical protein
VAELTVTIGDQLAAMSAAIEELAARAADDPDRPAPVTD